MAGLAELLIVSASTGTGHTRAAEALRRAASIHEQCGYVEHVDLLELTPRWVRTAYGDGYELLASRAPWLWRQVYNRTDSADRDMARWGPVAQRILFREFRRLLRSRKWNTCLGTHFLPGQLAAGSRGLPPFALVITDLTLHRFWAQPRVGRYFVGCQPLAGELTARLPSARVDVTGIPISPEFAAAPCREAARLSLGLQPDRPVLLVMGGGFGLGIEDTVGAALRADVPELQVVAICGRNQAAADRLRGAGVKGERLRVFEFVNDMERFLAAADLVVTKPGGLTTSEALAMGVPMLLTAPIPGQEEGNARLLCQAGAAVRAADAVDVTRQIDAVFRTAGRLESLARASRGMGHPLAAAEIVDTVLREASGRVAA